jgi:hypothetical protein
VAEDHISATQENAILSEDLATFPASVRPHCRAAREGMSPNLLRQAVPRAPVASAGLTPVSGPALCEVNECVPPACPRVATSPTSASDALLSPSMKFCSAAFGLGEEQTTGHGLVERHAVTGLDLDAQQSACIHRRATRHCRFSVRPTPLRPPSACRECDC